MHFPDLEYIFPPLDDVVVGFIPATDSRQSWTREFRERMEEQTIDSQADIVENYDSTKKQSQRKVPTPVR